MLKKNPPSIGRGWVRTGLEWTVRIVTLSACSLLGSRIFSLFCCNVKKKILPRYPTAMIKKNSAIWN